jgi:hypothetical protein
MNRIIIISAFLLIQFSTKATNYEAKFATNSPTIDGIANEACWESATWYIMDYVWLPYGEKVDSTDFYGRFKLVWTKEKLFLLAEITDDSLSDDYEHPLDRYWEDDCLEIFVDPDASGGNHRDNYNAFAYHIAKNYDVVDYNHKNHPVLIENHIEVKRTKNENTYTWEVAITLHEENFHKKKNPEPIILQENRNIGFSLAYCDSDASPNRENFIGSVFVSEEDKNNHWINASLFGNIVLIK